MLRSGRTADVPCPAIAGDSPPYLVEPVPSGERGSQYEDLPWHTGLHLPRASWSAEETLRAQRAEGPGRPRKVPGCPLRSGGTYNQVADQPANVRVTPCRPEAHAAAGPQACRCRGRFPRAVLRLQVDGSKSAGQRPLGGSIYWRAPSGARRAPELRAWLCC